MPEHKPTLRDLIGQHQLTALAVEHACAVHVNFVLMALGGTCIHVRTAQDILQGINKLAGTNYVLTDLNPDCYYGGLVPGSMFEWKGDGNVYHG